MNLLCVSGFESAMEKWVEQQAVCQMFGITCRTLLSPGQASDTWL